MVLRTEKEGESSAQRIALALYLVQANIAIRENNRKVA